MAKTQDRSDGDEETTDFSDEHELGPLHMMMLHEGEIDGLTGLLRAYANGTEHRYANRHGADPGELAVDYATMIEDSCRQWP